MVSADFHSHPVGFFLEALIAQLDHTRVELFAYPISTTADELTARIKPGFRSWRPLTGLSDQAAAQLIHADHLHVLIDLSGHTAHNRLPIFAWKPAPVQISWIGLPATTGMPQMDYVVGDPYAIPASDEAHFSERVWRLPDTYLCFTPPALPIDVGALPARSSGFVTFASFNNLTKMNTRTLAVWARVLKEVAGSRLHLKSKQLRSRTAFARTLASFAAAGIEGERLILEADVPLRMDHLATYRRVDIALDPFPYPGVTTSVEALWMGVPVVTLRGNRFLSRTAQSIACNVGLSDWIGVDEDDYIETAVRHAADLDTLAELRSSLREQLTQSPLIDAQRFARQLEHALWQMWARYAQGTNAA